jgi:hypothetical protein
MSLLRNELLESTLEENAMKLLASLVVLAPFLSGLSGCISSSSPPPPAKTTVVVPSNNTTTVVCADGTQPPCH